MPAYSIFLQDKHDVAPVGIKRMPGGQKDRFGIVKCSARRKVFFMIVQVETNKIGYLLTLEVSYFQPLSLLQNKCDAATGWYYLLIFHD